MQGSCASQLQLSARKSEEGSTSVLCSSSTGAVAEPVADRWDAILCCSPWGLASASWHAMWLGHSNPNGKRGQDASSPPPRAKPSLGRPPAWTPHGTTPVTIVAQPECACLQHRLP